jgi:hypothetical protein
MAQYEDCTICHPAPGDMTWNHYHCANCGEDSGSYGHWHSMHIVDGKFINVPAHFSCSEECDLNASM